MTSNTQHLQQLDQAQAEINRLSLEAFNRLIELLREGKTPREAIAEVQAGFVGAYESLLLAEFNKILVSAITIVGVQTMRIGGLSLSQALYKHSADVQAAVLNIINKHAEGFQDARKLALQLYEGYGFRTAEPLDVRVPLPKYLRSAFGGDAAFRALWAQDYARSALKAVAENHYTGPELARVLARINAAKLKTPSLRAAYLQALDALERGSGERALARVLKTAFFERNRYFANRIAQTELHRAYTDRQAAEIMAEPRIKAVRVRMSRTHPRTDICDLHAKTDQYGIGAGVYPKDKAPKPPFHPFCRCNLEPLAYAPKEPAEKPDAERQFLRSMPMSEAARVMGSRAKLEAVLKGSPVGMVYDAGKPAEYRTKSLGDFSEQLNL